MGFLFMTYDKIRLIIAIVVVIGITIVTISSFFKKKRVFTNDFIAKTAIFGALSIILYIVPVLKFTVPFFPSFLEIHLDEVPALIASFAYGPISGVVIIVIKTIAKLPLTTTACAGELCDLIYSIAFIVPAAIVYKKRHSFKGALLSLLIGMIVQIVVACFVTTFIMLDVYVFLYPFLTKPDILAMCQAINPAVTDLKWPFMFMVCLPFNAFKDAIVVLATILLYKRLHRLIDKMSIKKARA